MKRMNLMIIILLIVFLIASLSLPGCNPIEDVSKTGSAPVGFITISGAWALYPMMVQWAEAFQALYPAVIIDISAGGAGKGMADTLSGVVDIGMVSREIYPEEVEQGAFWVSVTKDAVFLTVNKQNPVWEELNQKGVSPETLAGIFITGEVTTWGQVIGSPDITDPIHVFTRSDACGAAETWAQFLGKRQEDLLGIGVYGDPGVIEAVINDPLAIGFNNLNYVFDFETGSPLAGASVIPLDINQNGLTDPQEVIDTKEQAIQAVANGIYPSPPARDLNLVTNGKPIGLIKTFIEWILTDGQRYITEVGYIPLSQEKLDKEMDKLR
jgi:phosphate transport system substrate-binding protein